MRRLSLRLIVPSFAVAASLAFLQCVGDSPAPFVPTVDDGGGTKTDGTTTPAPDVVQGTVDTGANPPPPDSGGETPDASDAGGTTPDATADAGGGNDAGNDAGKEAGTDAGGGTDAGKDAGVDAGPGTATFTLDHATRWVQSGGSTQLTIAITRTSAAGVLVLSANANSLPSGVTVAPVTVPANGTVATITVAANAQATLGRPSQILFELRSGGAVLDTQPFIVKVSGGPGMPDSTWGMGGVRTYPVPDPVLAATLGAGVGYQIATYPTGQNNPPKYVLVGTDYTSGADSPTKKLVVARVDDVGVLDTASFGTNTGYVLVDRGSAATRITPAGIGVDSQGRIVVAAYREDGICNVELFRLRPAGDLDPSFQGYSGNPWGACGNTLALTMLPNDGVAVLSFGNITAGTDQGAQQPFLQVFGNDGKPDMGFNGGQILHLTNPGVGKVSMLLTAITTDPMGRFLLAGRKCDGGFSAGTTNCESVLVRLLSDGKYDLNFGNGGTGNLGYSSFTFGGGTGTEQAFLSIALPGGGPIVVGGANHGFLKGTLARFFVGGLPDQNFGTSGRLTADLVPGSTRQGADKVLIDEDGRIVVVGIAQNGGALLTRARYNANGTIDMTYGMNGVLTTPMATGVPDALLTPDGRLLVVGPVFHQGTAGPTDIALWRFWP